MRPRGSTMLRASLSRLRCQRTLSARRLASAYALPAAAQLCKRADAFLASLPRRSSRLEPSAPERISARVASRPKKTYAEDDVFSDDDDFRDGGLGACLAARRRVRVCACGAHVGAPSQVA